MLREVNERMIKVWLQFTPIQMITQSYRIEKNHGFNRPNTLADEIARLSEEEYLKSSAKDHRRMRIIVDELYKIRDSISFNEIRSEIDTIILAGFVHPNLF